MLWNAAFPAPRNLYTKSSSFKRFTAFPTMELQRLFLRYDDRQAQLSTLVQ